MKVIHNKKDLKNIESTIVTLGNFDGVHLGHQGILKKLHNRGEKLNLKTLVYTFKNHPRRITSPTETPLLLTTNEEKAREIEKFKIDYLYLAPFTKLLAGMSPEDFVKKVLVSTLKAKEVFVGHDFAFGKQRKGTIKDLERLSVQYNFKLNIIKPFKRTSHIVSSSRVRKHLISGELEKANKLLGRPFEITGFVAHGSKMGRSIGYPTANITTKKDLSPKKGVYAGLIKINKKLFKSVINIGTRPTVNNKRKKPLIEAHIIDFKKDIYKKEVTVYFLKRIRDEQKFKSMEDLKKQIKKDEIKAKTFLEKVKYND